MVNTDVHVTQMPTLHTFFLISDASVSVVAFTVYDDINLFVHLFLSPLHMYLQTKEQAHISVFSGHKDIQMALCIIL